MRPRKTNLCMATHYIRWPIVNIIYAIRRVQNPAQNTLPSKGGFAHRNPSQRVQTPSTPYKVNTEIDLNDILRHLQRKYNFRPDKKYRLKEVKKNPSNPNLWITPNYRPPRHVHLPRDPVKGWSIKDLYNKQDFFDYFQDEFGNLPDGRYAVSHPRGGNKGFRWYFIVELRDGLVTGNEWKDKSNALEYGRSSDYWMFQEYFNLRQEHGV